MAPGTRLRQLVDVNGADPSNGHVLGFDTTEGRWAPTTVGTLSLDDGSVTNPKLGALSVATVNLQNASVDGTKLAGSSVGTSHLQALSVTAAKIANNAITATQMASGAATDTVLGNRTIVPATPTGDTATLNTLLNGIAFQIKGNSGKSDWKTAPAITLEALSVHASRHLSGGADPIATATASAAGLMSAADKSKLDGMSSGYGLHADHGIAGSVSLQYDSGAIHDVVQLIPAQVGTYLVTAHLQWRMSTVGVSGSINFKFNLGAAYQNASSSAAGTYAASFSTTVTVSNTSTAIKLQYYCNASGDTGFLDNFSLDLIKIG